MPSRLGQAFVSIVASSCLAAATSAQAQCLLDTRTSLSAFGPIGDPRMASVRSIDAGVALANAEDGANILRWNGSNWALVQHLLPIGLKVEDGFGATGSLRGDVAVVGALYESCDGGEQCGAVYVYRYDGSSWVLEARLTDPDSGPSSRFGRAIAFDGDVIAIRSDGINWLGTPFAGFWMYRSVGGEWVRDEMPIISAQDELADAGPIELDGDTFFVGMPLERCDDGRECGEVWIYRYDGESWSGDSVLVAEDARLLDRFGSELALDGSRLVVGAPPPLCLFGSYCGAAYVFHRTDQTWTLEAMLTAVDAPNSSEFGKRIALDGNRIIVGVPSAMYSYQLSGTSWSLQTKFDGFSSEGSIYLAGELVIATAGGRGQTYVISGSDCNEDGLLDACYGNVAPSAVVTSVPCDCGALAPVSFASNAVATGRFLSIQAGNTGRRTAIRVTSSDLPPPHDIVNGRIMWVGEPFEVSETSSIAGVTFPSLPLEGPTFMVAKLGCQPVYADRGANEVVHVYGATIIPGASYSIEIIDGGCPLTQASSFSAPSEFQTALWGDTVQDCSDTPCAAPDGVTHVIDALAIINKFANVPGAISKVRADLEPATPDLLINISDAIFALRAFSGQAYPFTVPDPCE